MKRMILAGLALVLALTAVPTFAADDTAPDMQAGLKHEMPMHHEMKMPMMQNPQHMLAMAYHKNLVTFAMVLKKAAQQGDTVPGDFARSCVTEMRRSADQMEIYHEAALSSMPADQKAKRDEMAKTMGSHLAEMRAELVQLEGLVKGDRVDSKELLKHLELIFKQCEGMRHGAGEYGREGHGKGMGCGCMKDGRDCDCMKGGMKGDCMKGGMKGDCMQAKKMQGAAMDGWQTMMQQRRKLMEKMKAQDAELSRMVATMNSAPKDQKQAIMADILTRLVKQRADMDAELEKLQEHMKGHMEGRMSHQSMRARDRDENSPDGDCDIDSGEMNSDDMEPDEADSDSGGATMDMKGMNMQDKEK